MKYVPSIKKTLLYITKQHTFYCSLIFFFVCTYWNTLMQVYVQNQFTNSKDQNVQVLKDFGFDILPYIDHQYITDYVITLCAVLTVLRIFATGKKRFLVARRVFFFHGLIFLLRSFSIFLTVLPNPFDKCKPNVDSNPFIAALNIMLIKGNTCTDVFFSGHAANSTIWALMWHRYTQYTWIKVGYWILTFINYFLIISTHYHYTIDVVYGIGISLIIWFGYFLLLESKYVNTNEFLKWFERDRHLDTSPADEIFIHDDVIIGASSKV